LPEDVFEYGPESRIGVLSGQQGNDQDRLFPLGVKPERRFQVLSVLVQDVKRGDPVAVLAEI